MTVETTSEWIIGEDAYGAAHMLIHARDPVFIARISAGLPDEARYPLSFTASSGYTIHGFVWLSSVPGRQAFSKLMLEAQSAIDRFVNRVFRSSLRAA